MFWFNYDNLCRLVAITFNLDKETKQKISNSVKALINKELSFTKSDVYLINNNNIEVQYLNILHDQCNSIFDIDRMINDIINDDLLYEDRIVINNIGSFGTTELVDFNGETLVRKRPKAQYPSLDEEYRFMEKLYLNNPNYFVKVLKDDYSDSYLMELAIDALSSYVKRKSKLDFKEAVSIINTLFNEIDYIHKIGYIHNDLHADNILLFKDGDTIKWKITDFGLSYNLKEQKFIISDLIPQPRHTEYVNYQVNANSIQNDFYSIGKIINYVFTKSPNSYQHEFKTVSLKCISRQYRDVLEIKNEFNTIASNVEC